MRFFPLLKKNIKTMVLLSAWVLIVLTWIAWRSDGTGGRPLVIIWGDDPGEYDPQRTSHPIAEAVFRHVCEPLFYEDSEGVLHGLLAEDNIEYETNGKQFTIHLRAEISFHNGTRLDAQTVQASFERLKLLGVSPLLNKLRDVTVIARPDGRSITFSLPEPDFEFPRLVLSNPYAAIVSIPIENSSSLEWVNCTGPYRFAPELYQPDHSLTLVRNNAYHWPPEYFMNREAANIPQIRFVFEVDQSTRLSNLIEGMGCILSLSREDLSTVTALPNFRLYQAMGGVTYIGFNFQYARWQDIRSRQAIALAINPYSLLEPGFRLAETPLTPNTIGFDPNIASFGHNYDLKRSQALLSEINFDFNAEVVLLIPESNTYRQIAAIVQEQLNAAGLRNVLVRELPRTEILTERQDFDLLLFDYAWGDYTAMEIFLGPGPRNVLGYGDNRIAELIKQARATAGIEQRQQLISEAQRIIIEEIVWKPLIIREITFAVNGVCIAGERQAVTGELLFHDAESKP